MAAVLSGNRNFEGRVHPEAKLGWQMQDYNPAGAVGNAAAATAEKGRNLVDAAGRSLAPPRG